MLSMPSKECSKCHIEKPYEDFPIDKRKSTGRASECRECHKLLTRDYYARNKEKARQQGIAYREAHEQEERERHQRYYAEHKADYLTRATCFRRTLRGKLVFRSKAHRRRAAERDSDISAQDLLDLFSRQSYCAYCHRPFSSELPATIDHVVPLSKGGKHVIENIVLACKPCNSAKFNHMPTP